MLARGSEYIVVECCSDQQALKAIRHRIHSQMNGLDDSAGKVRRRIREIYRTNEGRIRSGYDIVLVARVRAVFTPYAKLEDSFLKLMDKLGLLRREEETS